MFFVSPSGLLYMEKDGKFLNVGIKAKDKVVEVRELASTTIVEGDEIAALPEGCHGATLREVIAKFNVSERHPVKCGVEPEPEPEVESEVDGDGDQDESDASKEDSEEDASEPETVDEPAAEKAAK